MAVDERISGLSGEFISFEREARFRAEHAHETLRHARLLFVLSVILNTLFLASDWRFYGDPHFFVAVPARLVVVAISLVCFFAVRPVLTFRAVQTVILIWQGVTAVAIAFLVSSHSDLALFVVLLLPSIFYLVASTSFWSTVATGVGCSALMLAGYLVPDQDTTLGLILAVLTLNFGLGLVVVRSNRLRRLEWSATQAERQAKDELAESQAILERTFMAVPIPLLITSVESGRIIRFNEAAQRFSRIEGTKLLGRDVRDLYAERTDRAALLGHLKQGGHVREFECVGRLADGTERQVVMAAASLTLGGSESVISALIDVTKQNEREAKLRAAEAEYRALFENAVVGIYRTTPEGKMLRANPALVRLNGYSSETELIGAVNDIATEWYVEPGRRDDFVRLMRDEDRVTDFVSEVYRHRTRERIWVTETAWTVRDSKGNPVCYEGTVLEATDRKRAEAEVEHMARHDALTGLPNRAVFKDRLLQAIAAVQRHGESLAVLSLDLDRFKAVNDTLGHPTGDALLVEVARRLRGVCRAEDTVARIGGDEFTVLQVGLEQPDGARALAERIVEVVDRPYALDGRIVRVGTSVGIALAPMDGVDADQLVKKADFALYRAKADPTNPIRFFDASMSSHLPPPRVTNVGSPRKRTASRISQRITWNSVEPAP